MLIYVFFDMSNTNILYIPIKKFVQTCNCFLILYWQAWLGGIQKVDRFCKMEIRSIKKCGKERIIELDWPEVRGAADEKSWGKEAVR